MNRFRTRALALPLGFAALLSLGLAGNRSSLQDKLPEALPVAGTVHFIRGEGCGNIGLCVGEEGVFVVDAQLPGLAKANRAAIVKLAEMEPGFLLNTHWHGDHTGGNLEFANTATIVAHENVRRRMAGDTEIGGRVAGEVVAEALPTMTFEDALSFHLNGEEIRIQHYPNAHTDGDSVVWFRHSNVVHLGDLFFQLGYPYLDVDSGGSILGLIEALNLSLDWIPADARIIPGHGDLTDVAGLREYTGMLETVAERVRAGLDRGESADDLVAAKITADLDARWGNFAFVPPEKFVRAVARSLQAE